MANTCGNCGSPNGPETRFCTKCGTELAKPASARPSSTCDQCGTEIPEGKRLCAPCGVGRLQEAGPLPIQIFVCGSCGKELTSGAQFCSGCGAQRSQAKVASKQVPEAAPKPAAPPVVSPPAMPAAPPPVSPQAAPATPAPQVAPGGRRHSPAVARVSGVIIPGAGQAYNGYPFQALLLLISSLLVIPWVFGFVNAHIVARRMVAEGGRFGRGGPAWIGLQTWLAVDFALFVLIVLTMAGALS